MLYSVLGVVFLSNNFASVPRKNSREEAIQVVVELKLMSSCLCNTFASCI